MKTDRTCKQHKWILSIIPWGRCQACGKDVGIYLREIFQRCVIELPAGKLRDEITSQLSNKKKKR